MSGVGRHAQDRLLLAIQGEGVEAGRLVPERLVEALEQRRGLAAQLAGALVVPTGLEDLGHAQPGVVDVALQLAEGLGPLDQRAVRIDQRLA